MRTIIAGSRSFGRYEDLKEAIKDSGLEITTVLSGTAAGADKLGERWANENLVQLERYPAEWDLYGKSAGHKRNIEMAHKADALVLLWDGMSSGSAHMLETATRLGLIVHVRRFDLCN
jgi:hypothetical protein